MLYFRRRRFEYYWAGFLLRLVSMRDSSRRGAIDDLAEHGDGKMPRHKNRNTLARLLCSGPLIAVGILPGAALALTFEQGEWLFNVDTTLSLAAQWRTESRDKGLATDFDNYNLNDGNINFDTGLTSAKASAILEIGGEKGNFAFFLRGDALYDYVYEDQDSDLSRENYPIYNGAIINGGSLERGDFPADTLDEHGKRLRLLEAFINYEFELGGQGGSIRAGRQVIAWGEALIYQGVNTMQNPIDGGVALSPGVEAKEVFLPTAAVDLKWNFSDALSAETYYKLDWEETTQPGVGSFLSTSDLTGPGAERLLIDQGFGAAVLRALEPDDDGQWGAALRYLTRGGTNFTLSYTNSHANAPIPYVIFDFAGGNSSGREFYPEDIEFWQIGVSGNLGEASVYADLVYSDNAAFVDRGGSVDDRGRFVASRAAEGEYWQVVLGMNDLYTAFPRLSEQIVLTAELTYQGNDRGESDKAGTPYIVTDDAWGYQFILILNYYNLLPGMDVTVPISFRHDVEGYGGSILKNVLIEDQKWASVGVDALYLNDWQFSAKYSFYFGNDDPGEPILSDRDNFAISAKYRF